MLRKGLDLLLTRGSRSCERDRGVRFGLLLIGAGEDAGRATRARSRSAGSTTWILDEWVNNRARIAELLSAGDLYVFPSRHEGFPVAPVEAMACGLPVVATDVHGIPDIFARGEDGRRNRRGARGRRCARRRDREPRGRRRPPRRARATSPADAEAAFSYTAVGRELRRVLLQEAA